MHILFLSHYFPPEVNAPASRTYEHCRQWAVAGHRVTVVTGVPNHPHGRVYPGYRNRVVQRETVEGIEVVRVWTFVSANEGFLKRTLGYVSYMITAIVASTFLERADVVVTTSPQFFNGLAGYFVSRIKRMPWVLEIRDLWPESITAVGALKNRVILRILEYLEMFAYQKADCIVPVTHAFKRYMIEKGVNADKIRVITNGVTIDPSHAHEDVRQFANALSLGSKFVASYVGTHGMAHKLDTILEAAQLLRDRDDIRFLMVGDGAERRHLLALRDQRELKNVVMLEQQPRDRMPLIWEVSDVSLVLLRKSDTFKSVIPSKIFESMAMGKPIVLGVDGECRDIVETAGAGCFIEPESAVALARMVSELASDSARCRRLGEAGRRYVAVHYDRRVLARQFEETLRGVVQRCGGRAG